MQRIIFINQYITHLFVDIINDFVEKGIEVEVITGGIHSSSVLSDKVRVKKFTPYQRNNAFNRLFTWHLFGIRAFFYLLFQRRPLFVCTNPPFLPILAWIYARMKRQPFHVLYYDLYPEALERMGYLGRKNPVYRFWNYLNKKVLQDATTVFTISEKLSAAIAGWGDKPVHVIPPWTDHDRIKPLEKDKNPFIADHDLRDQFIILYSGNMGLTHDIETILHAAYRLQSYQDITFLMIGDGPKKKWAEQFIREKGLKNVILLPWQPGDRLPYTFPAADIGIVTLGQNADTISVPSKTYHYLAAGAALMAIAGPDSEVADLVRKYDCGASVVPGDADNMVNLILKVKSDPELLKSYKDNARKASLDFGKDNTARFYQYVGSK